MVRHAVRSSVSLHRARVGAIVAVALAAGLAATPSARGAVGPANYAYPSDSTVEWRARRLRPGDTLEALYGARWLEVARFNRMDRRHARPGTSIREPVRLEDLDAWCAVPSRLAEVDTVARLVWIDLSEQFLGVYESGCLVWSAPVTTGRPGFETPAGRYRIAAADDRHRSSLYTIEGTSQPYPMDWGLQLADPAWTGLWLHGRDLPGAPVSHGCIGLMDEDMQLRVYGVPARPEARDARRLFEWVVGRGGRSGYRRVPEGPEVRIVGRAPRPSAAPREGAPLAGGDVGSGAIAGRAEEMGP